MQFLPQTIPSFSAQTTFRNFREFYPQFFYKEAALNPTNTADLAKDWERELIEKLRRQSRNAEGRELPHERGEGPLHGFVSAGDQSETSSAAIRRPNGLLRRWWLSTAARTASAGS